MKDEGWHSDVPEKAIRNQISRIIQSPRFKSSDKQKRFLRFVVEEALGGRISQIKAYTVAIAIYDRPSTFDPQSDPIVRVEASRLRRALENYYLSSDGKDLVVIEIPKGGYVPLFKDNTVNPEDIRQPFSNQDSRFPGPSIILTPLVNLCDDEAQDYFIDGLTEELASELARFQEISVIATQSAMHFKYQQIDPKKIGRNLGVRFLLTGSVRRGASTVKVTIQLFDTETAEQV